MKSKSILLVSLFSLVTFFTEAQNVQKPPVHQVASGKPIDLNQADLSQLIGSFKGIGKKRAEAIIAYRTEHHGFKSIEELASIKGIGQRFIDQYRQALQEIFVVGPEVKT